MNFLFKRKKKQDLQPAANSNTKGAGSIYLRLQTR